MTVEDVEDAVEQEESSDFSADDWSDETGDHASAQAGTWAGGSWDGVLVTGECPDGAVQESYELTNNAPATGRAFITHDRAGFSVDKERSDSVTVTVVLHDEAGNGGSTYGTLSWSAEEQGQKCLSFSGFPLQADGDSPGSVNYVISLTNDGEETASTAVQIAVY